jgi:thiol-disulfide isomerase/thioredoxin
MPLPRQIAIHKTAIFFFQALASLALSVALSSAQQSALDLDCKKIDPIHRNDGRLTVLIFVRENCPVSARYAPTIQRLSQEHQSDSHFFLVFPDKTETSSGIRQYLLDFRYSIPALRDPGHALVKQSHAKVTPEAAVFDAKGNLIYHGRIDNLYEDFGRSRPAPTSHELEDAIQSAQAGRTDPMKSLPAVGCYISDLD